MNDRRHRLLRIEGMECEGCARHVTEALNSVPGVATAASSPMAPSPITCCRTTTSLNQLHSFVLLSRQGGNPSQIRFVVGLRMWF